MKYSKHLILSFASFSTLAVISSNAYAELKLQDYLKEVEEKNHTILASKKTLDGLTSRESEGKLVFRPTIYAQGQTAIDKKPTTNVNAQGDRTDNTFGTVGLMQQFDFGLKGKLGYTLSHTQIYNASSNFLAVPDFHDSQIALELSQSLWRNFYGIESRSQETLLTADVQAKKYIEDYKVKNILSSAESVFWSLSQMKKMVQVQKESLDRAKKIKAWAERRLATGLGEESDLLQSDANVKFREYELKTTEQQLQNLNRTFNSLRGIDNDTVADSLEEVKNDFVKALKLSEKAPLRSDTKAALEYEKLTKANLDLSIERNKPTLELYGSYALNGRDPDKADAISNGFKTDHSTTAIGIKFQAPLDFVTTNNNLQGYKQEKIAAELTVKQKMFDQDREWNDLVTKFENAKNNLVMVEKIEAVQKVKSVNERDRLSRGRTTTFQVLNFEQDYAQSELLRIKSELEILNLFAQSKTFGEGGVK
jgi:outer membrane protein TolC